MTTARLALGTWGSAQTTCPGPPDVDEGEVDRLLRELGLELPDVEGDGEDDALPPHFDEEWD